jgi:hypothetical protein
MKSTQQKTRREVKKLAKTKRHGKNCENLFYGYSGHDFAGFIMSSCDSFFNLFVCMCIHELLPHPASVWVRTLLSSAVGSLKFFFPLKQNHSFNWLHCYTTIIEIINIVVSIVINKHQRRLLVQIAIVNKYSLATQK